MILSNASFVGLLQPVSLGCEVISYASKSTSFGVIIDNHLNWKSHLTIVANNVNN